MICHNLFLTDSLTKLESTSERKVYRTSTRAPRQSSNINRSYRNNNIPSINSIAPASPTQGTRTGSRYTPPISLMESYAAASRNSSQYHYSRPASSTSRPAYTTARPYLFSTGPPASFKPVYYRVTPKPTGPPRSPPKRNFDDDYYDSDYEDDESSLEEPQLMINQHLRNGNNLYVRPISMSTQRPTSVPRTEKPVIRTSIHTLRAPPNTRNSQIRPSVTSFNHQGSRMPSLRTGTSDSSRSSEEDR